MHLLLLILTAFYLWPFIRLATETLPEWFTHFLLLPGLVTGLLFVPTVGLVIGAVCGTVLLIDRLVMVQRAKPTRQRKQSNIPPPP